MPAWITDGDTGGGIGAEEMRRRDLERGEIVIVSNGKIQTCAKFLELRYEIAAGRKKRL